MKGQAIETSNTDSMLPPSLMVTNQASSMEPIRTDPDIPGTVDMSLSEGQESTAYGLALYPVPSDDPNDPLQWPKWKKTTLLLLVSVYSFLANGSLFGPTVYVNYLADKFHKTPNQTSQLTTYPNLLFGFGSALSNSYDTLLGFRMLHAFASSVCEALPAQVVADVFFLHERGKALGWYTFALTTGTLSAVAASYMLAGGHSYNLFFWVEFAIGCVLLLAVFFLFEETMFFRDSHIPGVPLNADGSARLQKDEEHQTTEEIEIQATPRNYVRDSYLQQLKPIRRTDPNSPIVMMMVRSFTYFVVPPVFWVCSTYGIIIGLAALAFTATFPGIVTSPPYSWPIENTGLIAVSAFLGYLAAAGPFSSLPDRFSARLTKKNNNIYEAEYRLWCLVVVLFVSPASLILYGYSAEKQLHWFGLVFAVGLFQFGAFFFLTYTLAYAMDSYEANVPEMLIAMNIGKQAISFGFGYEVINWIIKDGYVTVFAGIFCSVLLVNNLTVFVFLVFGKRLRGWYTHTRLAKIHKGSIH
ncbi:uncharacterized protein FRV6_10625 [Fusarium oxysporum]|uniref:Major facilitator superfamily (MFS) profile domain-containing protein n=1 Tax=Fusarium oxysporum TaxID=5507 RepID=A0A2H3TCN1_FUSOX|nr:uncharacterized protein FRV6_10625 [Fusarium oxysporum]